MDDFVSYSREPGRFRDLYLNFCGYQACEPLHGFGPAVRPNYIIHFVLKGTGIFRIGDATRRISPGEGFLIEPGAMTFYQADPDDPWTYLWVGFEGSLAPVLMKKLGLGRSRLVFRCGTGEELEKIVLRMLANSTYSDSNNFLQEGLLYQFFAVLLREAEPDPRNDGERENIYVRSAEEYIRNNYAEEIRITDIAAYTGIHRSYLYTLFRQQLGLSPKQYLAKFRMSRAAELLSGTDYGIESVAVSCGYLDPQVFTKAFKAAYGMTPSAYRRNAGIETKEKLRDGRARIEELSSQHFDGSE